MGAVVVRADMVAAALELHKYGTGRQSRVITALTMLKQHLFRCAIASGRDVAGGEERLHDGQASQAVSLLARRDRGAAGTKGTSARRWCWAAWTSTGPTYSRSVQALSMC